MLLYEMTPVVSICLIFLQTMILIPLLCCSSTCLNNMRDTFLSSPNQAIVCILQGSKLRTTAINSLAMEEWERIIKHRLPRQ